MKMKKNPQLQMSICGSADYGVEEELSLACMHACMEGKRKMKMKMRCVCVPACLVCLDLPSNYGYGCSNRHDNDDEARWST